MKNARKIAIAGIVAGGLLSVSWAGEGAPSAASKADAQALVCGIKVLPDRAPDCSSLKSIAATVTRDCANNDAKAVAILNFMRLATYHQNYASEPGGIPTLKVITCYGWGVCGGQHSVMSSLWRELGWGWRFVGWPGHTTVEAQYDGRWHYVDSFLKFYAWMPDGKGGQTIASQDDLFNNRKELLDGNFVYDPPRKTGYFKNDAFVMKDGKANWMAADMLACDASWFLETGADGRFKGGVPSSRSKQGAAESWGGYNHATGTYSTDVNLAPGFALTSTWDPMPDAWYYAGSKNPPAHSCKGYPDTRNNPGVGLVLEPYLESQPARSYGNGLLTFAPDFSNAALLNSFVTTENVKYAAKALVPAAAGRPGVVVVRLASPYILTKASGEADGADTVEVSTDDGKTFKAADLKDFGGAVKGQIAAQVRITFKDALKGLKLEAIVQNNPCVLPYLSPGKNMVAVSAADPKGLGDNKLVVTYAYRLGSQSKSYEQICEQKQRLAFPAHSGAKWSDTVTYVRKTFTARDLPSTFEVDCPTPKGEYPVYPRMVFLRREVLAPSSAPSALPAGAVEAKAVSGDLPTLPNPFLIGTVAPR